MGPIPSGIGPFQFGFKLPSCGSIFSEVRQKKFAVISAAIFGVVKCKIGIADEFVS